MAAFRTEFSTRLQKNSIAVNSSLITLGSCFSDSIGSRLKSNKFNALVNPFGTIYNPISIHQLLRAAIQRQMPVADSFCQRDDIYYNYGFHSLFSDLTLEQLQATIEQAITNVHDALSTCDYVFITYGTSFIYERKDNGAIVANCHKQPAALFEKKLLSESDIVKSFDEVYANLLQFNPRVKVILTLSPVRHIKDKLELNSVSKAILRTACHTIINRHDQVSYFPAYEIMMDDLRDYRFYTSDLIHPSADAEEYIWEKFSDAYFEKETKGILQQWQNAKKMLEHKPFHTRSAGYRKFLAETLLQLELLNPKLNVEEEISHTKSLLSAL